MCSYFLGLQLFKKKTTKKTEQLLFPREECSIIPNVQICYGCDRDGLLALRETESRGV